MLWQSCARWPRLGLAAAGCVCGTRTHPNRYVIRHDGRFVVLPFWAVESGSPLSFTLTRRSRIFFVGKQQVLAKLVDQVHISGF